jgi:hypothetical protein
LIVPRLNRGDAIRQVAPGLVELVREVGLIEAGDIPERIGILDRCYPFTMCTSDGSLLS